MFGDKISIDREFEQNYILIMHKRKVRLYTKLFP